MVFVLNTMVYLVSGVLTMLICMGTFSMVLLLVGSVGNLVSFIAQIVALVMTAYSRFNE